MLRAPAIKIYILSPALSVMIIVLCAPPCRCCWSNRKRKTAPTDKGGATTP